MSSFQVPGDSDHGRRKNLDKGSVFSNTDRACIPTVFSASVAKKRPKIHASIQKFSEAWAVVQSALSGCKLRLKICKSQWILMKIA